MKQANEQVPNDDSGRDNGPDQPSSGRDGPPQTEENDFSNHPDGSASGRSGPRTRSQTKAERWDAL